MVVRIFKHVQWRWALNDRLAHGSSTSSARPREDRPLAPARRARTRAGLLVVRVVWQALLRRRHLAMAHKVIITHPCTFSIHDH